MFFYCKINPKQWIAWDSIPDKTIRNRRSCYTWTVRILFDYGKKLYVSWKDHSILTVNILLEVRWLIVNRRKAFHQAVWTRHARSSKNARSSANEISRQKIRSQISVSPTEKGFTEHFGPDGDCMQKFMDLGETIRKFGGTFKIQASEDTRISDIFIMKPSLKTKVKQYRDFVINDGTHNVEKWGLIAMFNIWVDCLGKSIINCY